MTTASTHGIRSVVRWSPKRRFVDRFLRTQALPFVLVLALAPVARIHGQQTTWTNRSNVKPVVRLSSDSWQRSTTSSVRRAQYQAQGSLSDTLPAMPTSPPPSTSGPSLAPLQLPPAQLPPNNGSAVPSVDAASTFGGGLADSIPAESFADQTVPSIDPPTPRSTLPQNPPTGTMAPPSYGLGGLSERQPKYPGSPSSADAGYSNAPYSSPGLSGAAPMPTMSNPSSGGPAMNSMSSRNTGGRAPAGSSGASVSAAAFNSNELRSQQNSGLDQDYRSGSTQAPSSFSNASQSRTIPASQVATGAPFVSQPRRGNYATVPYNPALFQHTLYERVQPQNALAGYARPSSAPSQLRPQNSNSSQGAVRGQLASAATMQPATQPQPPAPGFYPTAYQQCAPGLPPQNVNPAYVPPTITPNYAPNVYATGNAGYRPLFTLGQENYNVSLGRGIIGQPTVYVSGQPVRNFFRYLSP